MVDSSTLTFITILITGFVFLRWFISSDDEELDNASINNSSQPGHQQNIQTQRHRRAVTTDMIEVVHSIAPHLSTAQIRHDLQRTGSVQDTVDRILSEGTLPFPPGHNANTRTGAGEDGQDARNKHDNIKPENLLKKYGINEQEPTEDVTPKNAGWSNSPDIRAKTLEEKRAAMILKARKRLESQLKNEQDLSALK